MSCGNCGRQNPPSALYCLDCGQKLRDPGSPLQPAPPAPTAAPSVNPLVNGPVPETSAQKLPPMQAVVACPRCGVDNPPGMRFCRMCGGSMARDAAPAPPPAPASPSNCPRCRAALDVGAAFCGVCGLSATEMFAAVQPPRAEPQPSAAAQFAPPPAAAPYSPPSAGPQFAPLPPASPPQSRSGAQPVAGQPVAPVLAPVETPSPQASPPAAAAAAVQPIAPAARVELRTDNYGADVGAGSARLVTILKDGSEGPTYRLSATTTDIGRSEGNILLQDDPYLSPRHARVALRSGRYYLRDLGSVNGIFHRLRDAVTLQSGDIVLAGQQVLKLEVLTDAEASLGPVMHYGVMVFGTPELPRLARLVQLTTEGIPRDVFHLHRDETVIGRESGDVVFTDDQFLSRRHAAFKLDRAQRRVSVRDLGSSNGTLVQFRGEREIVDGDLFRIGHHLFRFDLGGRPSAGGPNGGPSPR